MKKFLNIEDSNLFKTLLIEIDKKLIRLGLAESQGAFK